MASNALLPPQSQGAATGFTSPSGTYALMRQIESTSAAPMNADIESNVVSAAYKAAWRAWRKAWLDFFSGHASDSASTWSKLGDLFYSDEISLRAESFRRELEDFYRTYPNERDINNRPVPAPRGKSPRVTSLLKVEKGFPWWAWALGLGAIGALGAASYVSYKRAKRPATRARTRSR